MENRTHETGSEKEKKREKQTKEEIPNVPSKSPKELRRKVRSRGRRFSWGGPGLGRLTCETRFCESK